MSDELCPKCNSPLSPIETTPSGRQLQRCSKGSYNSQTRKVEGCPFVKWLPVAPTPLDETCPKCGAPLELKVTRFGKKMKKCTKGGWDPDTKQPTGCPYIEWITGTSEELKEVCPDCGAKLILVTTAKGKKLKKCSTSSWDPATRTATGCKYVEWLNSGAHAPSSAGEEFLPPPPDDQDHKA